MAEQKTRMSLSILSAIHKALDREAKLENMEATDLAERILEAHALKGTHLGAEEKKEINMYRWLIAKVTEKAEEIVSKHGFQESITADAIAACMADLEWEKTYTAYVGDNPYRNGNPKKQNINPSFGYWIKKTLGAKSKLKDGKPENRKVIGSIIQSYTPLER